MATLKEIKVRISTVQNTKKITKTMEMVATAKSKRAVDRVNESKIYSEKLKQLTLNVASTSFDFDQPLLRNDGSPQKVGILVVSANRGLCGGFNNNVIKLAQERASDLDSQGAEYTFHLIGKKVINSFKFARIPFENSFTHIEDKPSYAEAQEIADHFIKEFAVANIGKFEVISTKYVSSSSQSVQLIPLLPFHIESNTSADEEANNAPKNSDTTNFIFEPSANKILSSLLPRSIRMNVFQALLESAASEQIARRIAMKNATENASEIIRDLTLAYNRARQAKITQEISEIVGGAAAIN